MASQDRSIRDDSIKVRDKVRGDLLQVDELEMFSARAFSSETDAKIGALAESLTKDVSQATKSFDQATKSFDQVCKDVGLGAKALGFGFGVGSFLVGAGVFILSVRRGRVPPSVSGFGNVPSRV
eukprot:tig00000310_g23992.t1